MLLQPTDPQPTSSSRCKAPVQFVAPGKLASARLAWCVWGSPCHVPFWHPRSSFYPLKVRPMSAKRELDVAYPSRNTPSVCKNGLSESHLGLHARLFHQWETSAMRWTCFLLGDETVQNTNRIRRHRIDAILDDGNLQIHQHSIQETNCWHRNH